jgi:hypothetical protein
MHLKNIIFFSFFGYILSQKLIEGQKYIALDEKG